MEGKGLGPYCCNTHTVCLLDGGGQEGKAAVACWCVASVTCLVAVAARDPFAFALTGVFGRRERGPSSFSRSVVG